MRHLAIILVLTTLCLSCRQNNAIKQIVAHANDLEIDTIKQNTNQNPVMILVMGDTKIELDSIKIQKINPEWIDKIEVMKSARAKSLFTDTIKLIYVYPKLKYHSRIKKLIMTTYKVKSYNDNFEMILRNSPKC